MANSPSKRWENGVLVERCIETARSRVLPDGTIICDKATVPATTNKRYRTPVPTRQKAIQASENKAVKKSK